MKLTIITINYNNREGLRKTIESVINQTFTDFEWIVIDGGSSDGSMELIEQYSDHFTYWVSEPDKGIYNAMNKGIKVAKGDYLQFLNSGDWLCDSSALERCFAHCFSADIAYGNLYFVNRNGEKKLSNYPEQLSLSYLYHFSLGHNASFIKRCIIQNDLYDERYKIVSDWAFYLKKALSNTSFEYLNEIITCFDTSGISSLNEQLVQEERAKVISETVPPLLIQDFKTMDKMKMDLSNNLVQKTLKYGSQKKMYNRLIKATLVLIDKLEVL